jgi:serine/threonine protein kinase
MSLGIKLTRLGFELKDEIGQEGMNSRVFKSYDPQLDATIVVKRIEKSKFADASKYYEEAKRLYASEHPYVVQIKYSSEDDDAIYLAMPFYAKGSLKKLIDSRFLTVREIVRYATQFLSGLNNIHVKKLVHYDVKPDNILLSDGNEALISDFGLAKNTNSVGLAAIGDIYMKHIPPEAFAADLADMRFDIFQAGLTLYRMCNGNQDFNRQLSQFTDIPDFQRAVELGRFPDRKAYLPHIPKKLRKIINKALAVNPSDRYQTVLSLLNDLALVDGSIDWQYKISADGETWEFDDGQRKYLKSLKKLANLQYELTTLKTVKSSSNSQKVHDECSTVASRVDAITKINEQLHTYGS